MLAFSKSFGDGLMTAAQREVKRKVEDEKAADVLITAAEQDTLLAPAPEAATEAPAPQPAEAGASGQVQDPSQSAAASSASAAGTDDGKADAAVADPLLETPEDGIAGYIKHLIPLPISRKHASAPTTRLQLCP